MYWLNKKPRFPFGKLGFFVVWWGDNVQQNGTRITRRREEIRIDSNKLWQMSVTETYGLYKNDGRLEYRRQASSQR
jgi:hypothetical protein